MTFGEAMVAMEKGEEVVKSTDGGIRYKIGKGKAGTDLVLSQSGYGWRGCQEPVLHLIEHEWEIYTPPKPKKQVVLHEALIEYDDGGYILTFASRDYESVDDAKVSFTGKTKTVEVSDAE